MIYEENPFEDPKGAEEWIQTVENERGTIREKEIDPALAAWVGEVKPKTLVEIGCGQGICSDKIRDDYARYIGVDPSINLINRARGLYGSAMRSFEVGNAYELPFESGTIDACFSVTVWFHLADLKRASGEMSRILKNGGAFMIITPDPDSYDVWENHYTDTKKEGNMFTGKAAILLNPGESEPRYSYLSKNTFYLHTKKAITDNLLWSGLKIDTIEKIGFLARDKGRNLFIKITGHKLPE